MKKLISFCVVFMCLTLSVVAQKTQVSDYYFKIAEEALSNNDFQSAIENIDKYINEYPKEYDGYMLRAIINYDQEKNGAALADINTALKLWKKEGRFLKATIYWWRAFVYQALELYDKALDDYEMTYKLFLKSDESKIHDILYNRAQLYYELERYDEADEDYRLMLKHNEADQVAMIGLVRNMIARKEYAEAVEMANKCEKFDTEYSDIYRFRMQAYGGLGKDDKAIDDAISYFEKDENAKDYLMQPYLQKHLSYALAKVNSKIKNNTDNHNWKMLRITIYEWNKDWVNAIREYNNLEKEYGVSQTIYYYRSICYSEIGDYENAIRDITINIENGEGDDLWALDKRAEYYFKAGEYDLSIEDYTKVIDLAPLSAYGYYRRGWCYELKKDYDRALENYNAGVDVDDNYAYIYLMRGSLYLLRNEKLLADADFEKILSIDTIAEDGSCRQYALHFLGKDEEAMEWMSKMIESAPEDEGMYYDKACLLSRMGKIEEAIASLKVAFEKGYRAFAHIKVDDDLDAIRNHPDFINLIKEYSGQYTKAIEDNRKENGDSIAVITEVDIKKMYSGVYEVPCNINGLPLKFIFDTGASAVSISSVEASFMLKNGYLSKEDIEGKEYFSTATGEIHEGTIIRLREIKIGDAILRNVKASVAHNQQAPLLLGQSVLERFGTITIDNINSKLIIKQ